MSTSSLTPAPSTESMFQSAPSSDTLDLLPPRPAPRRTYGKAKPAAPASPPAESSSSTSFALPTTSPGKLLANRWTSASESWMQDLGNLGNPPSDAAEEVDEDEARRAMERFRREARGEPTLVSNVDSRSATSTSRPSEAHSAKTARLGPSFSSSSLTSAPTTVPTSPPRSSPPPRALESSPQSGQTAPLRPFSSETAEETMFPVRKSGMSGKPRKIVMSDDDEEDENDLPTFDRRSSPASSPAGLSSTERGSSRSLDRRSSPVGGAAEIEEDEEGQDVTSFINHLAEEDKQAQVATRSSSPLAGLEDIFDHDDDEETPKQDRRKGKSARGLNKNEQAEMYKDMARAKREKVVEIARPEVERLPISSWLQMAAVAVKEKENKPPVKAESRGLRFAEQNTPSSPAMADEIVGFTPSSNLREGDSRPAASSSPTQSIKKNIRVAVPGSSVEPEMEGRGVQGVKHDVQAALAKKKEAEIAAKRKRLDETKRLYLAQQGQLNLGPAKADSGDELDLELDVTPKKEVKPVLLNAQVNGSGKRAPTAKGVLFQETKQPTVSRQRQMILQQAGRNAKSKQSKVTTETFVEHAGKEFRHADQKQINGGARPAGQKKGRDSVISHQDLSEHIKDLHRKQTLALRANKESEYGRVRKLPGRVEQEIIISATDPQAETSVADEDDGEEDDDFVPSDEDEDEKIQWSGEEAEEGSDEDEPDVDGGIEKGDSIRTPSAGVEEDGDDEVVPLRKPKPRSSARIVDSDDEDSSTPARLSTQRTPLKEVLVPQTSTGDFGPSGSFGEIDLAGFGDSGGSPGFSQLFGATQADDGEDAFAAMRAQEHMGLLPVNAMLPGVDISKTQLDRDNALIAAEVEQAAMERMQEAEPRKQYLNERGLFTQTKPAMLQPSATQMSDFEDTQPIPQPLRTYGKRGSSSTVSVAVDSTPYGKTQTQTDTPTQRDTPRSAHRPGDVVSPTQTQGENSFTRLRRRASDDERSFAPLSPTQASTSKRPENAFETMMAAASRPAAQPKQKPKSRMVDGEAVESDEDNGWGETGGGDEEEDEEDDRFLEELVDDAAVDEETKRLQDEAAAQKAREVQLADDEMREREARKIIEGEHRRKRRGADFADGESDDEDRPRRKWSKTARKKRKLEEEQGVTLIDGEHNAFAVHYDVDSDTDEDPVDEAPMSPSYETSKRILRDSPPAMSYKERQEALRRAGESNRRARDENSADLDDDLDTDRVGVPLQRRDTFLNLDDEDDILEEGGFSISKASRRSSSNVMPDGDELPSRNLTSKRSAASYSSWLEEESQTNRRIGGAAGVSVVRPSASTSSLGGKMAPPGRPAPVPHPHRQSTSSSSSGSILMSKGNRFG
ncbi:hypothetical protein IAU60_002620 [Kwoniella sp. DSM 27419]